MVCVSSLWCTPLHCIGDVNNVSPHSTKEVDLEVWASQRFHWDFSLASRYEPCSFASHHLAQKKSPQKLHFIMWNQIPQNHKMVELGKDLRRSTGLTTLIKKGHLELVVQEHVRRAFENLQGWRHHNLLRKPVPGLWKKNISLQLKVFLTFRQNFLCFSLCPLPLVLLWDTTRKSLGPSSLCPPFKYFYTLTISPLSLLLSMLNGSLSLSSYGWCSSPFIIFVALSWTLSSMSISHLCWEGHNWTQ